MIWFDSNIFSLQHKAIWIGRKNLDRPLPIQKDGGHRDWNIMSHLSKTHFVWLEKILLIFKRRTKWPCNSNELKSCKIKLRFFLASNPWPHSPCKQLTYTHFYLYRLTCSSSFWQLVGDIYWKNQRAWCYITWEKGSFTISFLYY